MQIYNVLSTKYHTRIFHILRWISVYVSLVLMFVSIYINVLSTQIGLRLNTFNFISSVYSSHRSIHWYRNRHIIKAISIICNSVLKILSCLWSYYRESLDWSEDVVDSFTYCMWLHFINHYHTQTIVHCSVMAFGLPTVDVPLHLGTQTVPVHQLQQQQQPRCFTGFTNHYSTSL
jgi:hypothetical protein